MSRLLSALALSAAILTGCKAADPNAPPPPCPQPKVVSELDRRELMAGDGPTDLVWRASFTGFGGGCAYQSGYLALRFDVDITLVSGPRAPTAPIAVEIPYFVAVQNPQGQLVHKEVFTLRANVGYASPPQLLNDALIQRIDGVTAEEGPQWKILFGLEMTPEEALRLQERRS